MNQKTGPNKRQLNREIAIGTMSIAKTGFYKEPNIGKEVYLDLESDRMVTYYLNDTGEEQKATVSRPSFNTKTIVTPDDTVTAIFNHNSPDKLAVLNFASAKRPGGGFLSGANAQEESLARSSTLICSIGNDAAKVMYETNQRRDTKGIYTDAMLFSPSVSFFRNADGVLISQPVTTSVITAPAVNKTVAGKSATNEAIRKVMRARMRHLFDIAIINGKTDLLLGAWGCGVFGNDPNDVANDFKQVLSEDPYKNAFENIQFAIPGNFTQTLMAFKKVF